MFENNIDYPKLIGTNEKVKLASKLREEKTVQLLKSVETINKIPMNLIKFAGINGEKLYEDLTQIRKELKENKETLTKEEIRDLKHKRILLNKEIIDLIKKSLIKTYIDFIENSQDSRKADFWIKRKDKGLWIQVVGDNATHDEFLEEIYNLSSKKNRFCLK